MPYGLLRRGYAVLIETSWNVKLKKIGNTGKHETVLIETSWNVKMDSNTEVCNGYCINRNIVECKGLSLSSRSTLYPVLIETSWNVKTSMLRIHFSSAPRINRNIVECKEQLFKQKQEINHCINRNIVECKGGRASGRMK